MPERDEIRREGRRKAVSGYTLRLPEEESVVLSGAAAERLIRRGDGDGALLYIAVVRSRGTGDEESLRAALGWPEERLRRAFAVLAGEGLVSWGSSGCHHSFYHYFTRFLECRECCLSGL